MPSDIRSFFAGKSGVTSPPKPKANAKETTKKRGRAKKVVEDDEDDDEEIVTKEKTPKKEKGASSVAVQKETTAGDFFAKGNKPKRTEPAVKPKSRTDRAVEQETPKKNSNGVTKRGGKPARATREAKKAANYIDVDDFLDDLEDAEDNFKAAASVGRRAGDDYESGTDDSDDNKLRVATKREHGKVTKLGRDDEDFEPHEDTDMEDTNNANDFLVPDDEEFVEDKPTKRTPAKSTKKRKSIARDEDEDDNLEIEEVRPVKKRASPAKKKSPSKKAPKSEPQDSEAMKAIFDSIPTIEAPPPPSPPKGGDNEGKPKFQYGQHANSAVPAGAVDTSELPQGQENCLAGLTFVFTGQLQRLGREQGQNLVKQYGGKVTSAPSRRTNFVVLGEDAGPKKLQTIKDNGLKVINEDGLFELIKRLPANGGDSAAAEKMAEKRAKEEENIRKAAEEMEKEERARLASAKPTPQTSGGQLNSQSRNGKAAANGLDSRLWTSRYAPTQLTQICGNKSQVEKLQRWLRAFSKNQQKQFKLAGADGSGIYRAVMIHGPPGIGKTTAAHLVAKLEGYDIVESNASDTRSKKLVETGLRGVLETTSLLGYFAPGTDAVEASKKKLVLIMDEVDGMSAGDRGGVGALAAVCKKTQIPMILICNDRKLPKMKPFDYATYDIPFRRPTTDMIRSRISTIAFREGLKMPQNVINALIEGTNSDIRQVVNMLSTAKLDSETLSFEDGKDMSKAWEKHIVLKPWDMVSKILGGGLFNPASKSTLNDKQELYFNDHDFAPLMLQENYLGTKPQRANQYSGNPKKHALATLDLVSKAADSISDGDLVDRMIHGSQQQWSLMPAHAIFSFVRPASFVNGTMAGHQTRFTAWLGKNSNQGKLMRMVKEIQGHMRLRVSADRYEVRQTYLPILYEKLINRLQKDGKDAVPDIIDLMDSYFLTKDDWDAILELGVGQNDMEKVRIESAAKASFTRQYNQQSHPMPFIKASQIMAPKRAPAKDKPDLEEAFDESGDEVIDDAAEVKEEEDDAIDLSKDKYVKQPKKRKAAPAGGASKKQKTKKTGDNEDEESSEEEKPKKGKGKGRAKK